MQFTVSQAPINEFQGQALILLVPSEGDLPNATTTINEQLSGFIAQLQQNQDMKGKVGDTLVIPQANGPRLILVGMGKNPMSGKDFCKAMNAAAKTLKNSAANDAAIDLSDIEIDGFDSEWPTNKWVNRSKMRCTTLTNANLKKTKVQLKLKALR